MMMDYFVTNNSLAPAPMGIQSTAGAVPVKNDKGEVKFTKAQMLRETKKLFVFRLYFDISL